MGNARARGRAHPRYLHCCVRRDLTYHSVFDFRIFVCSLFFKLTCFSFFTLFNKTTVKVSGINSGKKFYYRNRKKSQKISTILRR